MAKIWKTADKIARPVVSGVYFISKENEGSLMRPFPALFHNVSEFEIRFVHPLPENQVIQVDHAGFGFVMMHRSVIQKMRDKHGKASFFTESAASNDDDHFIGEDIIFFRKMKEAGIPLHAHTGAQVKHIKRFSLDFDYYALYWAHQQLKERLENESSHGDSPDNKND
jgi:hypothetical protein